MRLPNKKANFAAGLTGGLICTKKLLGGPVVKYNAATKIVRKLWITDDFLHECPLLAADLLRAIALPGSQWQLQRCQADLLSFLGSGASMAGRQREAIVFCTTAEKENDAELSIVKNKVTCENILSHPFLSQINVQQSLLHVCDL